MRGFLAPIVLAALSTASLAAEIRDGTTMQVKANSIWFEDAAKLAHWQQLKHSGKAAKLAAYQKKVMGEREAWQFTKPLDVKILRYERKKNRVKVEMTSAGRMQGTRWFIDASAVAQ
jgi:hypothetical protein